MSRGNRDQKKKKKYTEKRCRKVGFRRDKIRTMAETTGKRKKLDESIDISLLFVFR